MSLLSNTEKEKVSKAIAAAEKCTDAELVTVLVKQSDDYYYIPTLWAAVIALFSPGLIALTPFWLDLWEIILGQLFIFMLLALLLRAPQIMFHLIPKAVRQWRASNMARRQFLENNLHHTAGDSGVLIFVSEAERYVEIIADRGISAHVDELEWQSIVDALTQQVKGGRTLEGFLACIASCGDILQRVAPATTEKNELPNHLIVID